MNNINPQQLHDAIVKVVAQVTGLDCQIVEPNSVVVGMFCIDCYTPTKIKILSICVTTNPGKDHFWLAIDREQEDKKQFRKLLKTSLEKMELGGVKPLSRGVEHWSSNR